MTDLYGHKWTNVHGEKDETGNWGKALAGITKQQMGDAMKTLMRSGDAWPPSAPEFRKLCEDSGPGLGIPDVAAAWREACEASSDVINWKFSHPIVQEAARLTDWYSIRTGTPKAETVQNRFGKRYADLVAKLQRGEPLIDGQKMLSSDQAKSELEKSEEANEYLIKQRIRDQGLNEKTPEQIRKELLAKMGIKR